MAYLATFGGPRSERRFSETADVSLWSPLRQTAFLGLFLAAFTSNIGTWIQNVAAAWLMTSLAPNALMVGLVQTLSGLPVFLLIIPAGALADLVDRRRLLLFAQGWMFVAVALLGWLTVEGAMTPWVLLLLTFVVGIGAALNGPAWQASLPEQVPRDELTASIAERYSVQFGASDWACIGRRLSRGHWRWLRLPDQRGFIPRCLGGALPLASGTY